MSDQQNPAPLKDPSNKESTPNTPGNQNPSIARLARSWGPYTPPDTSYDDVEVTQRDDPVLLENIEMLIELMSKCDKDPTELLNFAMTVPPRLGKSIIYLAVGLLQQQLLVKSVLMATELRQNVKKGKKTRTKTRKLTDIKENNEIAENGSSMAPKGLKKKDKKNHTKENIEKAFGPAESNTGANASHLAVPKSKKKKTKKKKAEKATGIAENNPQLITNRPAAPLNTKTTAKDNSGKGPETIESNAGAITKKSTVSKSKADKAKENIDNQCKPVKKHAGAEIEQRALPKNKNKVDKTKTNNKDRAANTHEQANKAQPESFTGVSKTQNNNKIERCPKSDKGKKKAEASKTTDEEFFLVLEIEFMKKIQGRIERGIKDCQQGWTAVQKMEEAAESKGAKARKMQAQEQAKCSAEGG
ncbi:hypothetical protein HER10_EVM0010088 [Colletotrichum scovillei]|uniref:Uncharacterized protein n=1 Tax=Colletotrichum scovillei TaxID=1209932 RepID=A0A9P7UJR3_9PEZI|nr:uncharacterized protein HER10_EVM0010088 [Colletotrichum scovillei]KAF4775399.1 hypothetical protein HER10_EVM0010088 [Colletotrichum scovillei]KAG7052040.1 hypothetical protein JMJ77_0002650 [Colletotrichum scovillei]KAG7071074.1 hypothetical protein JMJ76_0002313 [Colletotrichum scovillei]KAG7079350.1 hypothetical protein JMJ78_0003004 [Colletotrichum scovillei]